MGYESSYKELEQKNEDLMILTRLIEVVHESSSLERAINLLSTICDSDC